MDFYGQKHFLICAALVLILALTAIVVKIVIQMKQRKKEEPFSLEEKQSIETGAPSDDHAPIIHISDLDEKTEAAVNVEMLLQSVSEDEAAAIPT